MTANPEAAGSSQTPAHNTFDTARLHAWMQTHIAGFAGPIEVRQFAGGQSNPTFLVQSPSRRYVLRRKPPGKLLPSAHAVDREFRVLAALKDSAVPVAHVHALCEDPEVIGSAFYVMDFVEGRIFWDALLPEAAPVPVPDKARRPSAPHEKPARRTSESGVRSRPNPPPPGAHSRASASATYSGSGPSARFSRSYDTAIYDI